MTDIIDRLLEKRQITETRKHRDFDVNGQINSVYREELFNPDGLEAVQEIERLKAIASKAIREQIPMREEIEALRAENERLREALKPFAEAADIYNLNDFLPSIDEEYTSFQIALCRAARAAMGESDE